MMRNRKIMPFRFNEKKTYQALGFLLRQSGHSRRYNYTSLLKLLYIADRESLKETGFPITGDNVFAMEHGPVLSHLYDLIRGRGCDCVEWPKYFEEENFNLVLKEDPGNGELCQYELDKLEDIFNRYRQLDQWQLIDVTHTFPEWIKNNPGTSSKPIPLEDILVAVGRGDDIAAIYERAEESAAISALFGD